MSTANRSAVERTPLPWPEISVALVVLTTEAISFQYLFPFVPFMVRGFGIREEDVGFYAGGIASAFMVGQFFSSFFWGRMSDMIGLKPVMLIGMTFTCITVALFGVSKSLEWAMATRFIGGLFNGVIGVTKTYLGLITDETNEAQAFGFLALCWGAGGILGPAIGGLLAQPSSKYPAVFPEESIWGEYPFLLPCLVTSSIPGSGVIMAFLMMKEPDRKKKRQLAKMSQSDSVDTSPAPTVVAASSATTSAMTVVTTPSEWEEGLSRTISGGRSGDSIAAGSEMSASSSEFECKESLSQGQVVGVMAVAQDGAVYTTIHQGVSCPCGKAEAPLDVATGSTHRGSGGDAKRQSVEREGPPDRMGREAGRESGEYKPEGVQHVPLLADDGCRKDVLRGQDEDVEQGGDDSESHSKGAMAYVLGRKAIVSTMAYAIMRLIVIGLDDALPLMMSTPPPSGMGMDSNLIGMALFGQGILLVSHVLFIFPYLKDRLGTLQLFWLSALTVPPVCWILPFVADLQPHVPPWLFYVAVEASMGLKCFSFATGFTAVTLLINNSAPARVIGTINGCSQTAAAAASMVAPSLAGSLFSWSLQNDMDFPFDFHFTFFLEGVFGFGLILCAFLAPASISRRYVE